MSSTATCVICETTIQTDRICIVPQDCPNEALRGKPCHQSCRTKAISATCVLCQQTIETGQIWRVPEDYPNEALRGKPCHQLCRAKVMGAK
jgi:hypothetical protein